jgi:hypothetical protein
MSGIISKAEGDCIDRMEWDRSSCDQGSPDQFNSASGYRRTMFLLTTKKRNTRKRRFDIAVSQAE